MDTTVLDLRSFVYPISIILSNQTLGCIYAKTSEKENISRLIVQSLTVATRPVQCSLGGDTNASLAIGVVFSMFDFRNSSTNNHRHHVIHWRPSHNDGTLMLSGSATEMECLIHQSKATLQAMPTDIMYIVIDRLSLEIEAVLQRRFIDTQKDNGTCFNLDVGRTMMLLFIFAIPPVIPFDWYAAITTIT
ncbi:hypothetical protein N7501_002019 [Penicillium viridicatum]|nr:hypothetical protein N7501_002019 [Penicillium viridicatum]